MSNIRNEKVVKKKNVKTKLLSKKLVYLCSNFRTNNFTIDNMKYSDKKRISENWKKKKKHSTKYYRKTLKRKEIIKLNVL